MTRTGWCPGDRSIGEMAGIYPTTSAVRVFFEPGEGLPASAWSDPTMPGRQRLTDLPVGCTVIVSFKDQFVDRLAFVEAWQQHRPDVELHLVPHHEPEQQTGSDPTKTQFDASWTLTAQQVGDHPARAAGRLRLGVCFTLVWVRQGKDWRTWFPFHVAESVDVVYGDWYPYDPASSTPWKPTRYEDPSTALKALEDIGAETGKPVGIAEINHSRITRANGFSVDLDPDGTLCAEWYKRMHAHAKAGGYVAWTHFHKGGGDLTTRPAEQQALRDLIEQEAPMTRLPMITRQESTPNKYDWRREVRGLVLHIAEGSYEGTIAWQKNPDSNVSSEFVIGRATGEWAQMMPLTCSGWTQRAGNGYWVASENAGYVADGLSDWQVEANARLLAELHTRYGVPLQVTETPATRGLGHHSMGAENGYDWGHPDCPGDKVRSRKQEIVARATQIIEGDEFNMTPDEFANMLRNGAVADALFDAVMKRDRLNNVYGDYKTNPKQMLESAINAISGDSRRASDGLVKVQAELAGLRAVVQILADTIKAGGGSVDMTAINQRLDELRTQVADEIATRLAE